MVPGSNFMSVTDANEQGSLYGELSAKDLEWTCPTGLSTETETWYTVLSNGAFATSQIIYSPVGYVRRRSAVLTLAGCGTRRCR